MIEDILLEIRCTGWSPEAVGLLSMQPAVEVAEDMADAGRDVDRRKSEGSLLGL
jgi:hypothetical protein